MGRRDARLTFGAALRPLSSSPAVAAVASAHVDSAGNQATGENEFRNTKQAAKLTVSAAAWSSVTECAEIQRPSPQHHVAASNHQPRVWEEELQ